MSKNENDVLNNEYLVTLLLTEHFGFPPLTLIDDVINAVNDIMYKCTQAMEKYLIERRTKIIQELENQRTESEFETQDKGKIIDDEIQMGTGKLETLLESQVDKNFDKFELYTLRNIFTLPYDLVDNGWIRLKHHEKVDFCESEEESIKRKKEFDEQITNVICQIKLDLHIRRLLKLQNFKAKKIVENLNLLKSNLNFLDPIMSVDKKESFGLSNKSMMLLKTLSPISDKLYFIMNLIIELIHKTEKLSKTFNSDSNKGLAHNLSKMKFIPSFRDRYIEIKSKQILELLGIINTNKDDVVGLVLNPDQETVENQTNDFSNILNKQDGEKLFDRFNENNEYNYFSSGIVENSFSVSDSKDIEYISRILNQLPKSDYNFN